MNKELKVAIIETIAEIIIFITIIFVSFYYQIHWCRYVYFGAIILKRIAQEIE